MRLVLLHALPFDGAMWSAHRDLLPGRTHTPTLYGLGQSVQEWADGVLRDIPDDDQLLVVGASVGGFCALEMAALAPDRVAAVVLVGAKAGHRPEPLVRDEALAVLRDGGMADAWDRYWAPLFGRDASPAVVAQARSAALAQDVDHIARGVRAFHGRRDLTELAATWPRPLVVVSGEEDRTPPPQTAALVAKCAARGEFHLVPRCGHYVSLEQPAAFASIVHGVLARVSRHTVTP